MRSIIEDTRLIIATPTARFMVMGVTGDITQCEHCGRAGLKRTVILASVDADGNPDPGDIVYAGTTCAAGLAASPRVTGRTVAAAAEAAAYRAARAVEERDRPPQVLGRRWSATGPPPATPTSPRTPAHAAP